MTKRQGIHIFLLIVVLNAIAFVSYGQDPTDSLPPDPGAISVYNYQNMNFGAFTQGASGGTVILSTAGARSVTSTVVGLNMGVSYYQAIFEIEGPSGTIISILNGSDITLTGSNGGTATLHLGGSSPGSPFVTSVSPPSRTQVSIGGTLTIGNSSASPPGSYSGTFSVTFNQE